VSKRYYWLKLNQNFFDSSEIRVLQSMESGSDYIILWQRLLLSSLDYTTETQKIGLLSFKENIPWDIDLMISVFGFSKEIINTALKIFQKLGMITLTESGEIWANDIQRLLGSETDSAERVRRHRKKIEHLSGKVLQSNGDVTNSNIEIEIEKEKEKERKQNGKEVLAYLNDKAHRKFKEVHTNTINALKKYNIDELKKIIDYKVKDWGADEKMKKYLRQDTLFKASHLDTYLEEAEGDRNKDDLRVW